MKTLLNNDQLNITLQRLAHEPLMPNLAISLHATTDEQRSELVPPNRKYPLADILAVCRNFPLKRRSRITFEYVMLAGVNDSRAHARGLASLLGRDGFKVNLIPYNPTGMYDGSSREHIARFREELEKARIPVTVRLTRGRDIEAACGQLAAAPKRRGRSVSAPA